MARTIRDARRLLYLACALVALGAPAPRARAYCRMTTSNEQPTTAMPCVTNGVPLAWRRRCSEIAFFNAPATLTLDQVKVIYATSFSQWQNVTCDGASPGFQVTQLDAPSTCGQAAYNQSGGNVQSIVFVDTDAWTQRMYSPNAYALTTVWHNTSTGEIYDVDMEVNLGRGPYGICDSPTGCPGGPVDLQNVITHEAGHYFGMGHTTVVDATMYAAAAPGEVSKRSLEDDDTMGFCAAYGGAGAPAAACNPTPRDGLNLACVTSGNKQSCGCSTPGLGVRGAAVVSTLGLLLLGLVVRRRQRR